MSKKIYIMTGEISGDILAADAVKAIKKIYPDADFRGITGDKLLEQGVSTFKSNSAIAFSGIIPVLLNIRYLFKMINSTVEDILKYKPDIIIGVDAQEFCYNVFKKISKHKQSQDIIKLQYVVPSVWAWRKKRAAKLAKVVNGVMCLMPFELPYFTEHSIEGIFVGHRLNSTNFPVIESKDFKKKYHINDNETIVLMLPGSRKTEYRRMMGKLYQSTKQLQYKLPNHRFRFFTVLNTKLYNQFIESSFNDGSIEILKEEDKYSAFNNAHFAIAASGTVTMELAKFGVPAVVIYDVSLITQLIVEIYRETKYASIVNVIYNGYLYPELLGRPCTVKNIVQESTAMLSQEIYNNKDYINKLKDSIGKLSNSNQDPSNLCAAYICSKLENNNL